MNIQLVIVSDEFERKYTVKTIIGQQNIDTHTFLEGDTLTKGQLYDELEIFSLFSKKRVIVIVDIDKASKEIITVLEEYCDNISPDICLVLTAASFKKTTRLYKKINKIGKIINIAELKPWEKERHLVQWLVEMVAMQKKNIQHEACFELVRGLGNEKRLLYNELQKLICFVGERNAITVEDVAMISSVENQETIWQLKEALWCRDSSRALFSLQSMNIEVPLVFLAQLRTQFQTGLHIASMAQENIADITKAYPYMKGRILEKNVQLVKNYGLKRFVKALQVIQNAEFELKDGYPHEKLLLEKVIMELAL